MSDKLGFFFLFFTCFSCFGQDITATIKTVNSVAPGKEMTIEINVNKPGVEGFIKYFQELPTGFTASDIDSKGGSFTNADNGAKIIWVSPPTADQFVISYKLAVPAGASGTVSLGGKFSYISGNERKTFELVPQVVSIGDNPGNTQAKESQKETPRPVETKASEIKPAETKPAETKINEEKPKPAEVKKEAPPVITIPENKVPATAAAVSTPGRSYRVQIGAFSQKPHIEGVAELTTLVLDNGMTKYFSGNFKSYDEAKRRREELVNRGFQGAFIVAFENGKIVK